MSTALAAIAGPLLCTVCPKQPSFSDVSHLLTHIGSKAHLSHYYKLKIESTSSLLAFNSLSNYDVWYANNGIHDLMSARMSEKNRKRSKARNLQHQRAPKRNKVEIDPAIDPFASLEYFPDYKAELGHYNLPLSNDFANNGSQPRLHIWPTDRPASFTASPMPDDPFSSVYQSTGHDNDAFSYDSASLATGDSFAQLDDGAKLKGIFWPGMDVFDSATNGMKRMRNQKKDVSVLAKLERHSRRVAPVEMVHRSLGDIKRQMLITGKVELSSPELSPAASLPPPSPTGVLRPPLADLESDNVRQHAMTTAASWEKSIAHLRDDESNKQGDDVEHACMPLLTSTFHMFEDNSSSLALGSAGWQAPMASMQPTSSTRSNSRLSLCVPPQFSSNSSGTDIIDNLWGPAGYDLERFLAQWPQPDCHPPATPYERQDCQLHDTPQDSQMHDTPQESFEDMGDIDDDFLRSGGVTQPFGGILPFFNSDN